jgi:uncharacterized Zn finger protein
MSNNKTDYQQLTNKPINCQYCGDKVSGQVVENYNQQTKKREKLLKWNCHRCGNVVRIGRPI